MTDEEILERWAEYFAELLNVDERGEGNEGAISMNMNVNPEDNKPLLEEVKEAIKRQRNRNNSRRRKHSQVYKGHKGWPG